MDESTNYTRNFERKRALAREFLSLSAAPEDAAAMLRMISDKMREDQAELAAAWQDRNAGKCWAKCATALDRAAATLDGGDR